MTAICEGALNNFDNLLEYKEEILGLLRRPGQKVRFVIELSRLREPSAL